MEEEKLPEIELYPALVWDCPNCQKRNIVDPLFPENAEEEAELKAELGISPLSEGDLMALPTEVTCAECLTMYCVNQDFSEEADETDLGELP